MAVLGPLWQRMDEQSRRSMRTLAASDLPETPGVYALYRDGERMYVGKAECLRDRVWKNHSRRGAVMTGSAMRRNVAEHLGIATSADIKARRYQPTPREVQAVRDWLDGCDIAWVECSSKAEAKTLEDDFKGEYKPPLTKR
jgi:hypothetical protein